MSPSFSSACTNLHCSVSHIFTKPSLAYVARRLPSGDHTSLLTRGPGIGSWAWKAEISSPSSTRHTLSAPVANSRTARRVPSGDQRT